MTSDIENDEKNHCTSKLTFTFSSEIFPLRISALNLAKTEATEACEHGQQMVIQRVVQQPITIKDFVIDAINDGNRTSCRPILSVIIRVINKIGPLRSGSPIC